MKSFLILLASLFASIAFCQEKSLFDEFRQILPRGRIAAVTQPEFVAADQAEIGDDSWVLGATIGGQARAYSLFLLNSHEVVNDQVGDLSFAAVW